MHVEFVPGSPLSRRGGGEEGVNISLRIGACTDELRLVGGELGSTLDGVSSSFEDSASAARKMSSAWAPPAMERMWQWPFGEGRATVPGRGASLRRRAVESGKESFPPSL